MAQTNKILKSYNERHTDCEGQQNLSAKLRNNVIFGKWLKNLMEKFDIKIVINRKKYIKWSLRQSFRKEKQFNNGFIMTEKDKCRIKLNSNSRKR